MTEQWESIISVANTLQVAARREGMQLQRVRMHGIDTIVCRAAPAGKLTRMHIFTVIGAFPPGWATSQALDGFMKEAVEHSIKSKGGLPRGSQTGTATVGVVVTDRLAPDAKNWAKRGRSSRFAALGYPVAVEVAEGRVSNPKRILIGAAYSGTMKRFVQAHVRDVLTPNGADS